MINEAIYTLYEGVGSVESIDTAMRLGANHPMGPLQLADFIGLDTCLSVMQVLHEGLADSKYRPCPLLVKYVEAGWLGRKTQRGFYDYRGEKPGADALKSRLRACGRRSPKGRLRGRQNRSGRRSRVIRSASCRRHLSIRGDRPTAARRESRAPPIRAAACNADIRAARPRNSPARPIRPCPSRRGSAARRRRARRAPRSRRRTARSRRSKPRSARGRDDALVDALETRADDDEPRPRRPFARARLRERCAARAHDQPRARVVGPSAASRLAASTSARITMPGPPPAGVSSTARWRPSPCSRMSRASSDHKPARQRVAGED